MVGTWIPIGGSGDFYLYSNENLHIMSDGTCYEGLANSITDNIVGGTIQKITYKTKTEGNTWNFFQAKINKTMDELLEPSNDLVRENYYSEDEIDFIKRTEFNTIYQITNATCEEVEKIKDTDYFLEEFSGTKSLLTITTTFVDDRDPLSTTEKELKMFYILNDTRYDEEYFNNYFKSDYLDTLGNKWSFQKVDFL